MVNVEAGKQGFQTKPQHESEMQLSADTAPGPYPDRIRDWCDTCGDSVNLPNKGLGRAVHASWETQHQH